LNIKPCMGHISGTCEHLLWITKYWLEKTDRAISWPFYLKLNLSKTIYFLKHTWFLYVLSKYQGMFKILQWNAMLRKAPTLKIARSSPRNSLFMKMETGRNFSISGINSGHHNLPTYEMSLKSENVEFVWYCGGHFENGVW
jgi:hypothetical protein